GRLVGRNRVGGTLSAAGLLAGTAALFVCTAVAVGVLSWRAVLAVPARVRIAYFRP
ncbi:hypothetical protein NDU88_005220, partial [Pleurodeles waltl]